MVVSANDGVQPITIRLHQPEARLDCAVCLIEFEGIPNYDGGPIEIPGADGAHAASDQLNPHWSHPMKSHQTGLVVYAAESRADRIQLVFDDVSSPPDRKEWFPTSRFTVLEFDKAKFMKSELSQQELDDLGFAVVARLAATSLLDQ